MADQDVKLDAVEGSEESHLPTGETSQKSDDAGGAREKTSDDSEAGQAVDEPEAVDAEEKPTKAAKARRRVSVSVRALLVTLLVVTLSIIIGVLSWLYLGARAKLDDEARQSANTSRAERIALDYAVDAAKINYQDLKAWNTNLVKGTTPELKEKLNGAAKSMEQILEPLQWDSTATPLVAKVRSDSHGVYIVDTFVGVETKTMQAPDGLRSTATYSITIDSNHDWQISEVGGIGSVMGQK